MSNINLKPQFPEGKFQSTQSILEYSTLFPIKVHLVYYVTKVSEKIEMFRIHEVGSQEKQKQTCY